MNDGRTHSGAIGGAEYQAMFVLDALCQNNSYDIHYLCKRVAPDFVPKGYKIRKVGIPKGLNRFGVFYDAFKVYKALKEIDPRISSVKNAAEKLAIELGGLKSKKYIHFSNLNKYIDSLTSNIEDNSYPANINESGNDTEVESALVTVPGLA